MSDEDKLPSVKTVLIVEDDQDIGSFILRAILYETSYQAIHVTDGYQALETVNTVIPNLLLVDYHLPRMNGIELFDRLHTREELEHVPVLMISAHLPKEEARKRRIPYLAKPFELDVLLKTIDDLIA